MLHARIAGLALLALIGACSADTSTYDGSTDTATVRSGDTGIDAPFGGDLSRVDALDQATVDAGRPDLATPDVERSDLGGSETEIVDAADGEVESAIEGEPAGEVVGSGANPEETEAATNGVHGGGNGGGSTDVYSMGLTARDGALTLIWPGHRVLNGDGNDLAVFENPFVIGSGPSVFMDQIIVELSQDGESWVAFPHDYVADDETAYSALPDHWLGFAGLTPVLLNEDSNPVNPFDPAVAGGDAFDLDDLPNDGGLAQSIRENGFTHVRLVAASLRANPDTGEPFPKDPVANGPDIDGIYARYLEPVAD